MKVRHLLRRVEEELLHALDLRPIPMSAGFASVRGSWKGTPVELKARAYAGSTIRHGRCIELWGDDLSIGNALLLPRVDLALPVFGLDIVATGQRAVMVAADLSPMVAGTEVGLPACDLPSGGELPQWCRRWFSQQALYTRVPLARIGETEEPILARVQALAGLRPLPEPARTSEIAAAQRAYCAAHLEDDKGLGMLSRMFGEAWAQRFLREVMFPA